MGRKKPRSYLPRNLVPNADWSAEKFNADQLYVTWFETFANIAMSRFIYECEEDYIGKYDSLNFIEACFFYAGNCMCHIEGTAPVFAQFFMDGTLNIYGLPNRIRPIYGNGRNGNAIPTEKCAYAVENIYNPQLILHKADYYATLCTMVDLTIVQNLNGQKHPYIITGTSQQKLSLLNFTAEIGNFRNAFYLKDDGGLANKITCLDLKVPLIAEDLEKIKRRYINEYLTFIGVLNNTTEKSERIITSENLNDNALTDTLRLKALKVRRDFCKRIEDLYGFHFSVKWNGNGITELIESLNMNGGEDDGKLYRGSEGYMPSNSGSDPSTV